MTLYLTLIILALTAVGFVSGRLRADVVALCALVSLVVFQILTPEEALTGFSNSVVIMMIGLFVVGGAIVQTGLAKMIGARLLRLAGRSTTRLFVLIMLVTAGIGAFISNTGTVALMLPIVVSMSAGAGVSASRFLMPLAFASSLGGMTTLIGTPPNLVIEEILRKNDLAHLTFFSFLPVGLICVSTGIIVLLPLSKWFLARKAQGSEERRGGKSLKELVSEYRLNEALLRLRVTPQSSACGMSISHLDAARRYGLDILEIRRNEPTRRSGFLKTVDQQLASAGAVLHDADVLYVRGELAKARQLAADYGMQLMDSHDTEETQAAAGMRFYNIGIAEILIMPGSSIINRSIREIGFREHYKLNVLGIQRRNDYMLHNLGDERVGQGDILLLQGRWTDIARLERESSQWVVLGQPLKEAARVTLDYKAPVAAAIMLMMVVMMVVDAIPIAPVTAVIISALLMVLTGCFRNVEAAYKTINWESVVLIAAMMPMSLALEKTGASAAISQALVSSLGSMGPMALLAGVYITTSILTLFISNTATAVLLAPIALQSALQMGISPVPLLFGVAVGASMCFASPFSTPPNALVMPAGHYTFTDYLKVGLPLQIIIGVVMILTLPLLFPF